MPHIPVWIWVLIFFFWLFFVLEAEKARKEAMLDYLLVGGFLFLFIFAVIDFAYYEFILKQNVIGAFASQIKSASVITMAHIPLWTLILIFFFWLFFMLFLMRDCDKEDD